MKIKKILAAGLALSMLLGTVSGLTACGEHTHQLDAVEKKAATCTEAGYEAYYKCSGCDKLFSDEKGEKEIEAPTAIPAGHKIEEVKKKDATCKEAGAEAHYKCTVCNKLFSDAAGKNVITAATPIPVAKHTIVDVSEKRPTCTEAGYEEHYKCTVCNKLFSDEEGTTEIEAPTAIPAEHRLVPTERKAPTCVEDGYEAYYACSICKKLYSDDKAANEITKPVVITKTGIHTPGFAYTSETVPAPVAEGGKLASKCAICGHDTGEVSYSAGLRMQGGAETDGVELNQAGTYYFQVGPSQNIYSYFGFHATKAGAYTIKITNVFGDENLVRSFDTLWILKSGFPSGFYDYLIESATWDNADTSEFSEITEADVANYKGKVNIADFEDGKRKQVTTITFTFTEEDVAGDGLYIMIGLTDKVDNGTTAMANPTSNGSYLIKFEEPAA